MEQFINWLKGSVMHNWHTTLIGAGGFIFMQLAKRGIVVDASAQQWVYDVISTWMLAHGFASKDGNKTGKAE